MRYLLALLLLLLTLSACGQGDDEGAIATPEGPTDQATLTPTPGGPAEATPDSAGIATPAPRVIDLTVWTNPDIPIQGDASGGGLLLEQIRAFDADRPAISVQIFTKSLSGQGSILNYLRTGKPVAPTVMPDLVLLPSGQLLTAADEQLVYPLDVLLPAELADDLYPAAATLATHDERLVGYPFAVQPLIHLAYNEAAVTEPLPRAWEGLLERDDVNLILPAAGPAIGRLVLTYYIALGGAVADAEGQPLLAVEPLTQALDLLRSGRQAGIIALRSSNVPDLNQAWQIYQGGEANATLVSTARFLQSRADGQFAAFAVVPGVEGPVPPLVEAWTWAISTADPARQQAAADLITWLVASQSLGAWSNESLTLPGRRAAFAGWPEDAYVRFIREELERARPYPATVSATYMEALADAAFNVISLETTAAEAAAQAAATVAP